MIHQPNHSQTNMNEANQPKHHAKEKMKREGKNYLDSRDKKYD
jgi:hypothetical protein